MSIPFRTVRVGVGIRPIILVMSVGGIIATGACERGQVEETSASSPSKTPSYCPDRRGDGEEMVRGRVLVPSFSSGRSDAGETERTAVGGRRESPAPAVEVVVYRLGDSGSVVAETTTDAKGRWCVGVAKAEETTIDRVAEARVGDASYRRILVAAYGQTISVRSEALYRVLDERVGDVRSVSPALYLNLQSVASSTVDLIDPVTWGADETYAAAARRVKDRLLENARFRRTLELVEGRPEPGAERD